MVNFRSSSSTSLGSTLQLGRLLPQGGVPECSRIGKHVSSGLASSLVNITMEMIGTKIFLPMCSLGCGCGSSKTFLASVLAHTYSIHT